MDNRYKGFGKEKLEFMRKETYDAFCMLTSAIYTCKWSKEEEKVLLNAQRILDYRTDRIKAAICEKGFEEIKNNNSKSEEYANALSSLDELFEFAHKVNLHLTAKQWKGIETAANVLLEVYKKMLEENA